MRKFLIKPIVLMLSLLIFLTACDDAKPEVKPDGALGTGREVLSIVSGSENKILEPILKEYAEDRNITIQMNYLGSLDIMRLLGQENFPYDAVWPAGSLWLDLGDEQHRSKHSESISLTPVVFGVRQSLAEELNLTGREISVADLLEPISAGDLKFCMTSATQSNSGAMAYLGFLYAFADSPEVLTKDHLEDPELQENIQDLLAGVDRSSGSSNWLIDLFLHGDYDAMVNYEALIINLNETLVEEGKEPLTVLYPYDGLSVADSPLAYIDQGDAAKEERFLDLQAYLLSDEVQDQIQKTGRRISYEGIKDENRAIFRTEWGIQPDRTIVPLPTPTADVINESLMLYQTQFKKPSLNVYALDYSGSMSGQGNRQLKNAMNLLLDQEEAAKHLLQASESEVNIIIPFNQDPIAVLEASGSRQLDALNDEVQSYRPGGGTDIYAAASRALDELADYDLNQYQAAIILMTDGKSGGNIRYFRTKYENFGYDIPIFSISFGQADHRQLEELAELSRARVFDGTEDLLSAFKEVKGYN